MGAFFKIKKSDYKQMPWKNGLGQTAEIDRLPASEGPYLWRLSQAPIQAEGPFSNFPGFDRWLAVCQGDGIFLNDKRVEALRPVRFSGDEDTFCRPIGSKVVDIGLIFDRARVDASMSLVEGAISLAEPGVHYLFDLKSGDTLKVEGAAQLETEQSLLISVHIRI